MAARSSSARPKYTACAGWHREYPNVKQPFATRRAAVSFLVRLHGLTPDSQRARELEQTGYVELDLCRHGNEYAEVIYEAR